MIALDATAALAFLSREPGAERVAALLDDSCMSTVNLAEVIERFARDGMIHETCCSVSPSHPSSWCPSSPRTQPWLRP